MLKNMMRFRTELPDNFLDYEAAHTAKIGQRVQNGAEFLDEKVPDWFERINPETLHMSKRRWWVLAQIAGCDYTAGLGLVGMHSLDDTIEHGFYRDFRLPYEYNYYTIAQDHWLKEVEKRLRASPRKHVPEQVNQQEET